MRIINAICVKKVNGRLNFHESIFRILKRFYHSFTCYSMFKVNKADQCLHDGDSKIQLNNLSQFIVVCLQSSRIEKRIDIVLR